MPAGEQTLKLTSHQAVIQYYFEKAGKQSPSDLRLVYHTAGRIERLKVAFAFQNLRLP